MLRVEVPRSRENWKLVLKLRGNFLYFKCKFKSQFFQYSLIFFIHSIVK